MQHEPMRTTDTDDLDPRRYPRYARRRYRHAGSATALRTVSFDQLHEYLVQLLVRLGLVR
jgi:hypothetical protein